ncbi:hypothetical protein HYH03_001224 [Edaphochlamys debaryana]|uniref:HPP transmembrane region domain-containing protein n=1 Tax=Edaphochlamys debaryana TaxID=47281 RepID=A0A835YI84_9CHLO|nr:hypothetical protein HYH03_001224 [Edaphochlamys debaryana]|eukprot:KAG2501441.1 hypothetical protein HYH03_001224 [Edaphochlamys debaryana]
MGTSEAETSAAAAGATVSSPGPQPAPNTQFGVSALRRTFTNPSIRGGSAHGSAAADRTERSAHAPYPSGGGGGGGVAAPYRRASVVAADPSNRSYVSRRSVTSVGTTRSLFNVDGMPEPHLTSDPHAEWVAVALLPDAGTGDAHSHPHADATAGLFSDSNHHHQHPHAHFAGTAIADGAAGYSHSAAIHRHGSDAPGGSPGRWRSQHPASAAQVEHHHVPLHAPAAARGVVDPVNGVPATAAATATTSGLLGDMRGLLGDTGTANAFVAPLPPGARQPGPAEGISGAGVGASAAATAAGVAGAAAGAEGGGAVAGGHWDDARNPMSLYHAHPHLPKDGQSLHGSSLQTPVPTGGERSGSRRRAGGPTEPGPAPAGPGSHPDGSRSRSSAAAPGPRPRSPFEAAAYDRSQNGTAHGTADDHVVVMDYVTVPTKALGSGMLPAASAAAPEAVAAALAPPMSLRGKVQAYFQKWRGVNDTLLPLDAPIDVAWSWFGAFVSIATVALLNQYLSPEIDMALMIASFGASAVLLFGVPASKLGQPRNFVGGQVLSALVGVLVRLIFIDAPHLLWLSSALGMSTALAVMQATRTVHPPGGASALIASSVHTLGPDKGFRFLGTVFFGSCAMLAVALVINNLSSRRRYPTYWMGH